MRKHFADTIEGFIIEMTNAYRDWEKLKVPVDKESAIVLNVKESKFEGDSTDDDEEATERVTEQVKRPVKKQEPVRQRVQRCQVCDKRHLGECTNVEAIKRHLQEKMERELAERLERVASIGKKATKSKDKASRVGTLRVRMDGAGSEED
jgi:hypothetical protein